MFKVKMSTFKKNKNGVEAAWGTIIMIIAVIASAIVILWVLKSSASKVDEELQVDLCRISNELLVGTEEASPWYLHGSSPRVCTTIWRTDKDLQIPTVKYEEKYKNAKDAAEAEVMDLIAKCWYQWLEGSKKNIFPKTGIGPVGRWWGGEGCYICYAFKIKNEAERFNLDDLMISMRERTYTAIDLSDNCAPNGGGFLRKNENWHCGPPAESGWKVVKSKKDEECCVRQNAMDECGNKGGMCSVSPSGLYTKDYPKWSCPETNQKCYLTGDSHQTYYEYIQSGDRGGRVATHSPINLRNDILVIAFRSYWMDKTSSNDPTYIEVSSLAYAQQKHQGTSKCEID